MSGDLECPYCGAENEVCHDDGQGYSEDERHEMQCHACEKNFVFRTSIHFSYYPHKADCLNDAPHELEPINGMLRIFPDAVRCKNCDYENRGPYKPAEEVKK